MDDKHDSEAGRLALFLLDVIHDYGERVERVSLSDMIGALENAKFVLFKLTMEEDARRKDRKQPHQHHNN